MGSQIDGLSYRQDARVIGTKGKAYTHEGDFIIDGAKPFRYDGPNPSPTLQQHADQIAAIRSGTHLNEGKRIAESTLTCIINPSPTLQQHADQIAAIRSGTHLNEGKRIAESTLTCIMGRMAAYTGRALKFDWALKASKLDLSPPAYEFGGVRIRRSAHEAGSHARQDAAGMIWKEPDHVSGTSDYTLLARCQAVCGIHCDPRVRLAGPRSEYTESRDKRRRGSARKRQEDTTYRIQQRPADGRTNERRTADTHSLKSKMPAERSFEPA